jgi:hypothetical protein
MGTTFCPKGYLTADEVGNYIIKVKNSCDGTYYWVPLKELAVMQPIIIGGLELCLAIQSCPVIMNLNNEIDVLNNTFNAFNNYLTTFAQNIYNNVQNLVEADLTLIINQITALQNSQVEQDKVLADHQIAIDELKARFTTPGMTYKGYVDKVVATATDLPSPAERFDGEVVLIDGDKNNLQLATFSAAVPAWTIVDVGPVLNGRSYSVAKKRIIIWNENKQDRDERLPDYAGFDFRGTVQNAFTAQQPGATTLADITDPLVGDYAYVHEDETHLDALGNPESRRYDYGPDPVTGLIEWNPTIRIDQVPRDFTADPIKTTELADGAVTTEKLADEAVTTEKIKDRAVTRKKLSEDVELWIDGKVDLFFNRCIADIGQETYRIRIADTSLPVVTTTDHIVWANGYELEYESGQIVLKDEQGAIIDVFYDGTTWVKTELLTTGFGMIISASLSDSSTNWTMKDVAIGCGRRDDYLFFEYYPSFDTLPTTGNPRILYITLDNGYVYYWNENIPYYHIFSGVEEAPMDGGVYARCNGQRVEIDANILINGGPTGAMKTKTIDGGNVATDTKTATVDGGIVGT